MRRALVVDDDRAMVSTLCDILELQGWGTERAYSGEEAITRAEEEAPTVVVMDIKMGGLNGVETLRILREMHPNLKVVLMTAYSASALVEEAEQAGAITVLAKPLDPSELVALLASLIDVPRQVLVVDDDPAFLTTLTHALEGAGYGVLGAQSVDEALRTLASNTVAAVLLDMVLPDTEPSESVVAIRRASPSAVFILFSGYRQVLARAHKTLPEGWVRACLHKPFPVEALLEALDAHD